MKRVLIIIVILFLMYSDLKSQMLFDKIEDILVEKNLEISYGIQLTWYKDSHIHYVQEKYNQDIQYQFVSGRGNEKTNFLFKGQFGVPSFKISVGMDLSKKYSLLITGTHLTYEVNVDEFYYRLGKWNGINVSDRVFLENDFRKLEHSNGITMLNIGIRRNVSLFSKGEKVNFALGIMPNIGMIYTATQGEVKNPSGNYEHYDPGNSLAGFNYGIEGTFRLLFKKHWLLGLNLNYFQMSIKKAKLEESSYVNQMLRGSNYGITLGYKFSKK